MLSRVNDIIRSFNEIKKKFFDDYAIIDGSNKITYKKLDYISSKINNFIKSNELDNDKPIILVMKNSTDFLFILLGIIKSNHPFLPIDIDTPVDRINDIINDSNPAFVVVEDDFIQNKLSQIKVYKKSDFLNKAVSSDKKKSIIHPKINNIAYIIYTSGTSGKPKGVRIEYKSLLNYINWAKKYYPHSYKKFVFYSSISFDLTLTSIFLPMLSGGTIYVYENFKTYGFENLPKEIEAIKLTPSQLELMILENINHKNLKLFIVGGEQLNELTLKKFIKKYQLKASFYNEYGPTEATIGCIVHKYENNKNYKSAIPIGRPIDNMNFYLLDENLKKVKNGEIGELYLSGIGLAKDYYNRKKLTSEKFFKYKNKRVYKSGDLAKYLNNKELLYLGRIDSQVKIRGFRIELSEIEEVLMKMDRILKAIVIISEDKNKNKKLLAYLILNGRLTNKYKNEIISFLKKKLPSYMIPNYFMQIPNIPLTINSKIDITKLPNPFQIQNKNKTADECLTNNEKILINSISKVLNISSDNINLNDSFLLLGGDSLNAIELIVELKSVGYDIKLNYIYELSNIKKLSKFLKKRNEKKEILKDFKNKNNIIRYNDNISLPKKMESYLKPLEKMNIFSGSIVISKNSKIICEYYHGYANKKENRLINKDTHYPIGSITKTFTATIIMQLIEKNKLSLDDPVKKFFKSKHWDNIQIKNLLTHTAGLYQFEFAPKGINSVDDILKKYEPKKLLFRVNERYKYSNLGYLILTKIIEIVTKTSYRDYLEKHIFFNLNLKKIGFLDLDYYKLLNSAIGNNTSFNAFSKIEIKDCILNSGTSSLYALPFELIKWARDIFENKLMIQSTRDQMMQSYFGFCGLGWKIINTPHGINYSHFGDAKGYSSILSIYPKDELIISICCNSDLYLNQIEKDIANIIYKNSASMFYEKTFLPKAKSKLLPWNKYLGRYKYSSNEIINMIKMNNALCIKKLNGRTEKLYPIDKNTFYSKRRYQEVTFKFNQNKIDGFLLNSNENKILVKKI